MKLVLQFELTDAASVGELNRVGFNGESGGVFLFITIIIIIIITCRLQGI